MACSSKDSEVPVAAARSDDELQLFGRMSPPRWSRPSPEQARESRGGAFDHEDKRTSGDSVEDQEHGGDQPRPGRPASQWRGSWARPRRSPRGRTSSARKRRRSWRRGTGPRVAGVMNDPKSDLPECEQRVVRPPSRVRGSPASRRPAPPKAAAPDWPAGKAPPWRPPARRRPTA